MKKNDKKMKAVYKAPGLAPEVLTLDGLELSTLQHYCEGTVCAPFVPCFKGMTLWANDEGVIYGMRPNVVFDSVDFFEPMVIVGPILVTGISRTGKTIGLKDEQVEKVKSILSVAGKAMDEAMA